MGIPNYVTCLPVCRSKAKLEPDMEQDTDSKLGKESVRAVYCHPAYLTYMQSISYKMLGWMKHKLESRLPREISTTSEIQMTPASWQKTNSHLMKVKQESEKAGLKLNIQKTKMMASGSITSWQIDGATMETVTDYFLWLQNHCGW